MGFHRFETFKNLAALIFNLFWQCNNVFAITFIVLTTLYLIFLESIAMFFCITIIGYKILSWLEVLFSRSEIYDFSFFQDFGNTRYHFGKI